MDGENNTQNMHFPDNSSDPFVNNTTLPDILYNRVIFPKKEDRKRKWIPRNNMDLFSDTIPALDLAASKVQDYYLKTRRRPEKKFFFVWLRDQLRYDESLRLLDALVVIDKPATSLKVLNVLSDIDEVIRSSVSCSDVLQKINERFKSVKNPLLPHIFGIRCEIAKNQKELLDEFVRLMYHKMANALHQEERSIHLSRLLAFFKNTTDKLIGHYRSKHFNGFLTNLRKNFPIDDSHIVIESVLDFLRSSTLKGNSIALISDDANLEFLLYHARREGMDYYSLWTGVGSENKWDWAWRENMSREDLDQFIYPGILQFIKPKFLRTLLTYGCRVKLGTKAEKIMCQALMSVGWKRESEFLLESSKYTIRKSKRWEKLTIYIFAIIMEDGWESNTETIRLIMRSDPDPYITSDVMYSIMTRFVVPTCLPEVWQKCLDYESANLYDEDYSVYLPRRLLHLARCAIRKRLGKYRRLPVGIEELGLPQDMKDYLNLKR